MTRIPGLQRIFKLRRAARADVWADVDEELRFHLEMATEDLRAAGLSESDARAAAVRRFGDLEATRRYCRHADLERERRSRLREWGAGLAQDVAHAARGLRRQPGVSLAAGLVLALGVGASTAIFSVVDGVLLAPLPYAAADRIVTVWQDERRDARGRDDVSALNFLDWKARARSFAHLAAIEPFSVDHIGPDGPEHIRTWLVTDGFFETMGARPMLGRLFLPGEYADAKHRVVLLSHREWKRRFAGDPHVVGRRMVLDDAPATIVGVMPPGFEFPGGRELWAPKVFSPADQLSRAAAYYQVVGRLAPGVSVERADGEMRAIAARLAAEHPRTNATVSAMVVPLATHLFGAARPGLLLLLAAAGLLLLNACASVANILLVRTARREREFAVRVALGASRGRVARQLLAEALVLAVAAGALGAVVAYWGAAGIRAIAPATLPRADAIGVDARALGFALLVSALSACLAALAPALRAARAAPHDALKGARASGGRHGLRRGLAATQVALSVVLLVGAGLLVRSFVRLLQEDRGYRAAGVAASQTFLWQYYRTPQELLAFGDQLLARLRAVPGVQAAALTTSLPLSERIANEDATVIVPGAPAPAPGQEPGARSAVVTPGFLAALGISLRAGRDFQRTDDLKAARVILVNERFARRFFPGESAVGKRVRVVYSGPPIEREIVGVVGDVRHAGPHDEPGPALYVPFAQAPTGSVNIVVRAAGDADVARAIIRRELWALNGSIPLYVETTLDRLLDDSLRARRFTLALLACFAASALVLAAAGLYGVLSTAAAERTRELGIRVALGAGARDVFALVAREGLVLGLAGTAAGLAAAALATRALAASLYGTSALDPVTYLAVGGAVAAVSLGVTLLPARRATRVDPTLALRSD